MTRKARNNPFGPASVKRPLAAAPTVTVCLRGKAD